MHRLPYRTASAHYIFIILLKIYNEDIFEQLHDASSCDDVVCGCYKKSSLYLFIGANSSVTYPYSSLYFALGFRYGS